jgi:hypothetical protein
MQAIQLRLFYLILSNAANLVCTKLPKPYSMSYYDSQDLTPILSIEEVCAVVQGLGFKQ